MSKQGLSLLAAMSAVGLAAWLWVHYRPVLPPRIVDLAAVGPKGVSRPLTEPSISAEDGLEFNVEISEPAFLYVYRVAAGQVRLESSTPTSTPLPKGVYAPEWVDYVDRGLRFPPGKARIYAFVSPQQLEHPGAIDAAALESPGKHCVGCAVGMIDVVVSGKLPLPKQAE